MERANESGVLWLKKPGKMRWEYRSNPGQANDERAGYGQGYAKFFVSDGKNAWLYVPEDRQVEAVSVKQFDDLRSPLGLFLGKTKLEKELQALALAPDVKPTYPGDVVFRGVPKTCKTG